MIKLLKKLFCFKKVPKTAVIACDPHVESYLKKLGEIVTASDFRCKLVELGEKGMLDGDNPVLKISFNLYSQVQDMISYNHGYFYFCGKNIKLEAVPSSESDI